jgi:hypothetical protein
MIKDEDLDEFQIWFDNGVKRGWITDMFCATHDGIPSLTEEEEQEWEDGGDPCQFCVRIME